MSIKTIDKLAWIELDNGKILSSRSKGKDTFYIPGGKREPGESDHDALVREIREELGVTLVRESLEFVGKFTAQAHGHSSEVRVTMTCYRGRYSGELRPCSEIEEIAWFTYADRERSSPVDKIIFKWLRDRGELRI